MKWPKNIVGRVEGRHEEAVGSIYVMRSSGSSPTAARDKIRIMDVNVRACPRLDSQY